MMYNERIAYYNLQSAMKFLTICFLQEIVEEMSNQVSREVLKVNVFSNNFLANLLSA